MRKNIVVFVLILAGLVVLTYAFGDTKDTSTDPMRSMPGMSEDMQEEKMTMTPRATPSMEHGLDQTDVSTPQTPEGDDMDDMVH